MPTVTLTIDGRRVEVEKGTTVLRAAVDAGISIPYYCFHPGLTVDGSCRVCIVKIEKMPKLQTSCSTFCTDGMVVTTRDPETTAARAGVFEFLLVNHPLDCPVCDKGGECPLQDFSYAFGSAQGRMDFPRRVFDGEGVKADIDFGPTLMLNRNRCILCTRCVRFMREIDSDAQIGIVDRGNGSEIATFREEGVHSLLSGNLMDVCPVGAITTKEYRFKSRPWDNAGVIDTICTRCSKGCNVSVWLKAKPEWAKGSRLIRVTPRYNPEVNGYWMCDIGRFDYHWVEGDDRLREPLLKRHASPEPASWHEATASLGNALRRATSPDPGSLRFLTSAHASTEELFVLRQIVDGLAAPAGAQSVAVSWKRTDKPQPPATTFRVSALDAPNLNGARDLGYAVGEGARPNLDSLRKAIEAGQVTALYVLDPGPAGSLGDVAWIAEARRSGQLPLLIVQGVAMTELAAAADIVLPGATYLEKNGVYANEAGRVQAASRAIAPPGDALEDWQILVTVAGAVGISLPYRSSDDVRRALAAALPDSPYADADRLVFGGTRPAGTWLHASNPSERWKWDFLFQDLPPVKGHNVQMEGMPVSATPFIPLKPVG